MNDAVSRRCFVTPTILKSDDYHVETNSDLIVKWFKEKLLPNLEEPNLIVIDNAACHSVLRCLCTENTRAQQTKKKKQGEIQVNNKGRPLFELLLERKHKKKLPR